MSGDKILLAGAAMNGLYGLQIFSDQDKAAGAWENSRPNCCAFEKPASHLRQC